MHLHSKAVQFIGHSLPFVKHGIPFARQGCCLQRAQIKLYLRQILPGAPRELDSVWLFVHRHQHLVRRLPGNKAVLRQRVNIELVLVVSANSSLFTWLLCHRLPDLLLPPLSQYQIFGDMNQRSSLHLNGSHRPPLISPAAADVIKTHSESGSIHRNGSQ